MDNGNKQPLTEKEVMKKALRRKTRYRIPSVNIGVVIITVLFLLIIGISLFVIMTRDGGTAPGVTETVIGSESATDDLGLIDREESIITVPSSDVCKGELILVNSDHEYTFPDPPTDVSVFDNKSKSYKVANLNINLSMDAITPLNTLMDDFYEITECRDVMVNSGFRSEEDQRQLYADRVATQGAEMAAKYVSLPGHSEHHTGLAMDLTVYMDSGEGHKLVEYEPCKWLVENFENYGFILRYPSDKVSLTGIDYEPWHYRYVGVPHSLIMKEKGWVLEEYIEYLRNLPEGRAIAWNGTASEEISLDGMIGDCVVYYVPASEEPETLIPVPKNMEYTVSGDNVGGFIVTVNGGNTDE